MGWNCLQFAAVEMLGLELAAGLGADGPVPILTHQALLPLHCAGARAPSQGPLSPTE